jgi:hypothetical protein
MFNLFSLLPGKLYVKARLLRCNFLRLNGFIERHKLFSFCKTALRAKHLIKLWFNAFLFYIIFDHFFRQFFFDNFFRSFFFAPQKKGIHGKGRPADVSLTSNLKNFAEKKNLDPIIKNEGFNGNNKH